jgi:hypothetical protein
MSENGMAKTEVLNHKVAAVCATELLKFAATELDVQLVQRLRGGQHTQAGRVSWAPAAAAAANGCPANRGAASGVHLPTRAY